MGSLRNKVKEIIREEIATKKTAHFRKVGRAEPSMGEQDADFLEDEDLTMFEKIMIKNECTDEEWREYAGNVRAAHNKLAEQFEDRGFMPQEPYDEPRSIFKAYLGNMYTMYTVKKAKKEMEVFKNKQ